ncbi:MAG: translation initiation factor IF-2 [Bacteroidetes bacterium]|nr:translation initiation factor IF-2 [Bacteroidota bacterium]
MSASTGTKLFKVASTINIGRDAIVEFLVSKGFKVENKATSVLTDEMVHLVTEKFSKELKHAEKQREKVERQRGLRKTLHEQGNSVSIESFEETHDGVIPEQAAAEAPASAKPATADAEVAAPTVAPPADVVPDVAPAPIAAEPVKAAEEPPAPAPAEPERPGPAVGTVIDLGGPKKPKAAEVPPVAPPPSAPPAPAPTPVAAVVEEPVAPVAEVVVPEAPVAAAPAVDAEATATAPEGTADATAPAADAAEAEEGPKQKKKRKGVIEVQYEPGTGVKLKGLTVLGKIDLAPKPAPRPQQPQQRSGGGGERPQRGGGGRATIGDAIAGSSAGGLNRPGGGSSTGGGASTSRFGPPKKPATSTAKKKDDKKRKNTKGMKEQFSDSDVTRAIRATLSGMEESGGGSKKKMQRLRREIREGKEAIRQEEMARESTILKLSEFVTTADLANLMNVTAPEIILKCMGLGLMVSINQRLDKDTITLIAGDYGYQVEFMDDVAVQDVDEDEDSEESMQHRPPIVTIMGHVDHGKTSLLDYIRKASVVAGEAGGITQHIGAYRVELPDKRSITFLDTPGHEAFTAMRARGAQVTDIVVLVVAADDSVMPQTIEAISHAQAANVPIVVAINKIDKPDANPDRIKQELSTHGVLIEEWGGKTQCIELSAKTGLNVDTLLEKILLEADILELKADPDRNARGTVIEAHVDKGRGNVVTVIVQKGTLKVGDIFVCGQFAGRVRAMTDERGHRMETAGPSMPCQVTGFDGLPYSGDILVQMDTDSEAREVATKRQQLRREQLLKGMRHVTLDDISAQISVGGVKELRLVVKGDVSGSVEALSDSLQKLSTAEVKVRILYAAVGPITESDIMLASASDAIVIGFQVNVSTQARKIAEAESVELRLYSIIYDCINEVQAALEGLLSPDLKEEITATVEVRAIFKISKLGTIAGCYVTNGKITRNDKVRILRDGFEIYKGTLASLKRVKDDVREVDTGYECGVGVNGFNDLEVGDIIESYKTVEIKRKLT